jgi:hypothetical protein
VNDQSTLDKDFSGLNLPLTQEVKVPFMQDKKTGEYSFLGLPYRGPALPFKNDDPTYQQPQYHFDVHIEQFASTSKEDAQRWTEVCQKVADGKAFISFEERQYDQVLQGWRILLRWCEPHFDAPTTEPVS